MYSLTRRANLDIDQIWFRISFDSREAADSVEGAILETCRLLGDMPRLGRVRSDLTRKPVLVLPASPYDNYYVVYRIQAEGVLILRVLHAARRRVWKSGI